MAVNFNMNAGVTDLVQFVASQVARYNAENRKQKIFAMAKDCSKRLKLPDWDIEVWPPEAVTSGVLDVISSSKTCGNDTYFAQVAGQLAGFGKNGNCVDKYVANLLSIEGKKQIWEIGGTVNARRFCDEYMHKLVRRKDTAELAIVVADQISSLRRSESRSLFPLWTFSDPAFVWSRVNSDMRRKELNFKWSHSVADVYHKNGML